MGRIRELPQSVIEKIAAGEVVEGPYSVVKELIENSIDAGADYISVKIYSGGKERIVVADNGVGMDKEDLLLAVRRYATSKIKEFSDLYESKTLGFRGEALASIGAVSHLEILSAFEGKGNKVEVDYGAVRGSSPAAIDRGTVVKVDGLFANLPARLKFLKSAGAETRKVVSVMESYILGFPDISFELFSDDKRLLFSSKDAQPYDSWISIFGKDTADKLKMYRYSSGRYKIMALLSSPYLQRRRPYLSLMVNGHPVRDMLLRKAVFDAYKGFVPAGWSFIAFVSMDISPSELDFNVHPSKWEVKFRDGASVYKFVFDAIRSFLKEDTESTRIEESLGEKESYKDDYMGRSEPEYEISAHLREVREAPPIFGTEDEFEVLGQLWDTYILVLKEDVFYIVDQHVASEKIIYEKLLSLVNTGNVNKQGLLFPKIIEYEISSEELMLLNQCGFEVESFGQKKFMVRAVPSIVEKYRESPIELLLKEVLQESGRGLKNPLHSIISSIACRAAMKAGRKLAPEEQRGLLRDLFKLDDFLFCPHGRPIIIELKREDVERMFKRK